MGIDRIPLNAEKAEYDITGKRINDTYVFASTSTSESNVVPKTNSDQLGGLDASKYATIDYVNAVAGNGGKGGSTVNLNGAIVEDASFYAPTLSGTPG
jgi:hypothetical protein